MSSNDSAKSRGPKKGERVTDLADVELTDEENELFDDEFMASVEEGRRQEVDRIEAEARSK